MLLGFEPMETLRFVSKAAADRTVVLLNTRPIVPASTVPGAPAYPALAEIQTRLAEASKRLVPFDAVELATRAGTPKAVGAVMIGALAGLGQLPVDRQSWLDALTARAPARFRDANLQAFDLGTQAVQADSD